MVLAQVLFPLGPDTFIGRFVQADPVHEKGPLDEEGLSLSIRLLGDAGTGGYLSKQGQKDPVGAAGGQGRFEFILNRPADELLHVGYQAHAYLPGFDSEKRPRQPQPLVENKNFKRLSKAKVLLFPFFVKGSDVG